MSNKVVGWDREMTNTKKIIKIVLNTMLESIEKDQDSFFNEVSISVERYAQNGAGYKLTVCLPDEYIRDYQLRGENK